MGWGRENNSIDNNIFLIKYPYSKNSKTDNDEDFFLIFSTKIKNFINLSFAFFSKL